MSVERELFANVVVVKDSIFFDFLLVSVLVSDFGREFFIKSAVFSSFIFYQ